MIEQFNRLIAPLRRRIMLTVGRCVLAAVNDSAASQTTQVSLLAGESRDGLERMTEYGFTSKPFPQAEGVAVFVGGDRGHGIVIATADRRYRLTGLADGEVAIYDDQEQIVKLKRNGIVVESSLNVLVQTDGILRLEGDGVEIHGRTYVQQDVHGRGQRETWTADNDFTVDTYLTDTDVTTNAAAWDPPALDSDHPDA